MNMSFTLRNLRPPWVRNITRLVLGCMDSYDSNQILILQHFSGLSGEKKVQGLFFPPKKRNIWKSARASGGVYFRCKISQLADFRPKICQLAAWVAHVGRLKRPRGYQRLTLGQPSVNVRSTFGIFPSHRGLIFTHFDRFVD